MRDRIVWVTALFLCAGGITAAARRAVFVADNGLRVEAPRARTLQALGLSSADTAAHRRDMATLDARFAQRPLLTRLHVLAGAAFLLLAPLQFWRGLRNRFRSVHRWSGRVLLILLAVSVIASFQFGIVAPFAGAPEQLIIGLVGVLVIGGAARGFWAIRHKRVQQHREWMLRVFALAMGIASVRIVDVCLELLLLPWHASLATSYVAALWIGWGGTLAGAEWWIHETRLDAAVVS